MRVNLNNGKYVRVYAIQKTDKIWDVDIYSSDYVWCGSGTYMPEYGRGLENCDANFSDEDYDLIDKALGVMVLEIETENSMR